MTAMKLQNLAALAVLACGTTAYQPVQPQAEESTEYQDLVCLEQITDQKDDVRLMVTEAEAGKCYSAEVRGLRGKLREEALGSLCSNIDESPLSGPVLHMLNKAKFELRKALETVATICR